MNNHQQNNDRLAIDKGLLERAKIDVLKKQECREIIQEINKFGVTDGQRLDLIDMLALELENRECMQAIHRAVKSIKKDDLIIAKIDND